MVNDYERLMQSLDFSELEVRVTATQTVPAFQDLHRARGSRLFNTPVSDVTPDQRRAAKSVGFFEAYGPKPQNA